MTHEFNMEFQDGETLISCELASFWWRVETTNYLIDITFKKPLSQEWIDKTFNIDCSRVTEWNFVRYIDMLLQHVASVDQFAAINKSDNKVVRTYGAYKYDTRTTGITI